MAIKDVRIYATRPTHQGKPKNLIAGSIPASRPLLWRLLTVMYLEEFDDRRDCCIIFDKGDNKKCVQSIRVQFITNVMDDENFEVIPLGYGVGKKLHNKDLFRNRAEAIYRLRQSEIADGKE